MTLEVVQDSKKHSSHTQESGEQMATVMVIEMAMLSAVCSLRPCACTRLAPPKRGT